MGFLKSIFGLIGGLIKTILGVFGIGKKSEFFMELDEGDSESAAPAAAPAPAPAAKAPGGSSSPKSRSTRRTRCQSTRGSARRPGSQACSARCSGAQLCCQLSQWANHAPPPPPRPQPFPFMDMAKQVKAR